MTSGTKTCQSCKKPFVIEPDDFAFYEKIKVPAPDLCSECRSQERTAFRNESVLYRRKCGSSGKQIISIYSPDKPYRVYDQDVWWSDGWDPLDYGRDFDFSRPFFEQFGELLRAVPRLSIVNRQSVASDYCNYSNSNKNCYLCFGGHENENCGYCWYNWKDKECFDCLSVIKSELTWESNFGNGLYRSAFLEYCFDCVECYFGYNLVGCQNCFLCSNVRNKQYHFLNEPLSKEEYQKKVARFWNGSFSGLERARALFKELKLKTLRNPVYQKSCTRCVGGDIMYSKNIVWGFDGEYSEDSKFVYPKFTNVFNSMDTNKMGYDRSERCYMTIGCAGLNNCRFCDSCWNNHDLTYCNFCFSSGDLFGCVGLQHKDHCILNKQYDKAAYEELRNRIIEHMKKTGEWGRFFPSALSPFAYNETTAQEYTPLSQSDAAKLGYAWKESEEKSYKPTLNATSLPDNIEDVADSITKEIVACAHAPRESASGQRESACMDQCITAFRIAEQELRFYRQIGAPIPRLCHNCRHHARLRERNPLKLWHRACRCSGRKSEALNSRSETDFEYVNTTTHFHGESPCPNEFETSYAPERPEVVYCENCYQSEVA